jgi:hypothetical protein
MGWRQQLMKVARPTSGGMPRRRAALLAGDLAIYSLANSLLDLSRFDEENSSAATIDYLART